MGEHATDDPQAERALQAWELVVLEELDDARLEKLRRATSYKRFELDALRAKLPGPVRRGARIDLLPMEAALREAGVACEVRRRGSG